MSKTFEKKKIFKPSEVSVTLLTPFPINVEDGLALENGIQIEKKTPELINLNVGLGGEVLISEKFDDIHILTLTFIPSAVAVYKIDLLKKLKTRFGILIKNGTVPKYKGIASNCRVIQKPNIAIGGLPGWNDSVWKIAMIDYLEVYTGGF